MNTPERISQVAAGQMSGNFTAKDNAMMALMLIRRICELLQPPMRPADEAVAVLAFNAAGELIRIPVGIVK